MSFGSRIDMVFSHTLSCGLALGALALALPVASCSDDGGPGGAGAGGEAAQGGGGENDAYPNCKKGEMEADFVEDTPLAGPGVDPETGALVEGSYFIATTYLAMKPGTLETVMELSGPVIGELTASPGFVAVSTANSSSCLALRTLTVWESEEQMFEFVAGPAHNAAMGEMHELSRGTSNTISWQGPAADVDWEVVIEKLGAEEGGDK
jgi:hypothetical protein